MSSQLLWQLLVNGLSIGAVYVVVVFGMQVIVRVAGVVNFAHGQFYAIGAYAFWFTFVFVGINLGMSIILALLIVFIFSAIAYRLLFHYVAKKFDPSTPLSARFMLSAMASIGLMMVLARIIILNFGTDVKSIPPLLPQILMIGDIRLPAERLAVILLGVLLALGLYLFFYKTKLGMTMRAVSTDPLASLLVGVDSDRISLFSFAFGCMLAGAGGMIVAPIFALTPEMGTETLFMAFIVLLVGGISSYKGSVGGGLIVGLAQSFGYHYIGIVSNLVIFILVMLLLNFRPGGFFGKPYD